MAITGKITEASRAIHTLEGLLKGIAADREINIKEIESLKTWLDNHKNFSHIYPFSEAYTFIDGILEDGIIDQYEKEEIIDFCDQFQALEGPIDQMTKEMRNLHGFLHGIVCDREINTLELEALKKWLTYHNSNIGLWPYSECYDLVRNILKDGKITEKEKEDFISFAKCFAEEKSDNQAKDSSMFVDYWMNTNAPVLKTIDRIVDKDIDIIIHRKHFCLTGQMKYGTRKDIQSLLVLKGGFVANSVIKGLNYLVVGALSNPCWIYSTYGRKIEKVMRLRNDGIYIPIINEDDFYNTLKSI